MRDQGQMQLEISFGKCRCWNRALHTWKHVHCSDTKEQRRQGAEAETRKARVTNYSPLFSLPLIDHNAWAEIKQSRGWTKAQYQSPFVSSDFSLFPSPPNSKIFWPLFLERKGLLRGRFLTAAWLRGDLKEITLSQLEAVLRRGSRKEQSSSAATCSNIS